MKWGFDNKRHISRKKKTDAKVQYSAYDMCAMRTFC